MSTKLQDLTGRRYGRLLVLKYAGRHTDKHRTTLWECLCDCGNKKIASRQTLNNGLTKSCGCLVKDVSAKNIRKANKHNVKHGMTGTKFYSLWRSMKYRCSYKKNPRYKDYGGRGIKVCQRWQEFINFKNDMYEGYLKHIAEHGENNTSIDRIDVNGNYEPENCRWATNFQQATNKRTTVKYRYKGKEYSLYELAKIANIKPTTMESRLIDLGWSVEKAVKTKIDVRMRNFRYRKQEEAK